MCTPSLTSDVGNLRPVVFNTGPREYTFEFFRLSCKFQGLRVKIEVPRNIFRKNLHAIILKPRFLGILVRIMIQVRVQISGPLSLDSEPE